MMKTPQPISAPHPLIEWPRESGKVAPLLQMMEEKLRRRRRRRAKTAGALASVAGIIAIAFVAVPYVRDTDAISTGAAERLTKTLADGSTLELNARTHVRTDYRYGRRRVEVAAGEAYFEIAADAGRPFVVVTPAGTVQVLGTAFNVRIGEEGAGVVTLEKGAVVVRPAAAGDPGRTLKPGDQATLDRSGLRLRHLAAAGIQNELAWRTGNLALDGIALRDAAARFSQFHGLRIDVSDSCAGIRLGGSCPLGDLAGFFDFIRESAGVQVVKRGDGSYTVRRPGSKE